MGSSTVVASSTPGSVGCVRSPVVSTPISDPLLVGQVLDGELAEQVVDEAGGDAQVGVVGHARGLEPTVRERLDERTQRHAVLQTVAHRDRERVHDPRERGALLRHVEEELTGTAVLVLGDGREPAAVGDPERERLRVARARQLLAHRLLHDDVLDDPLDLSVSAARSLADVAFFCVASGCATLQLSR